jgi:hypothetical protein
LRYIIRGMLITLLAGFVVFKFGIPLFHALTTKDRLFQKRMDRAIVSIAYVLDDKQWTSFPISLIGIQARVVTNANLLSSYDLKPDEEMHYAYQFQVIDEDENILSDRIYHHRTKMTTFKDEEGDVFTNSFYLDSDLAPFDSRSIRIDFSGMAKGKLIRFRLLSKDASVSDVELRLYIYLEHEKEQPGFLWRRLSDKQKTRLTKGNVYPHELLAEEEKRNLIQRTWVPLGPLGADGKDYQTRKLYVLQEAEGEAADFDLRPAGLYVKEGHRGIIPVPEEGGKIRLEFLNMSGRSPQDILLRWYGRGIGMRMDYTVSWEDGNASFEEIFKGGMIEISPSDNIAVKAFLINGAEEIEITPDPIYARSFIIRPGLPVEYKIHHTGDKPTPLRVVFRYQIPKQKDGAPENLRYADYQLLDKDGKVLKSSSISLAEEISLYDGIAGNLADMDISEPFVSNFYIPHNINSIRFSSGAEILIASYTRPYGMTREVRVPEDYYAAEAQEGKQPGWFAVRPVNYKGLVSGGRSLLIAVQLRPAEDNEDLMAGRYLWEDFHPEGSRPSRYILTAEAAADTGRKNREGYYSLLSPNNNIPVEFVHIAGLAKISPTLIYIRKSSEPVPLKFFLDNNLHYETRIAGTRGEIQLPPVRFGRHKIRVESPGKAEFYLNNIQGVERVFFKRFVNRIDSKGLDFVYKKQTPSDELLSVRFYSPSKNMERNTILASIDAGKIILSEPFESWTFTTQRFSIKPDSREQSAVLNTYNDYLESGQLFFVRLGSDLPPGDYHVHFDLESGTGGYLSLSRVLPGLFEERKFYKERGVTDDIILY